MAVQNYHQYGWPIQEHLQTIVAEIAPNLKRTLNPMSSAPDASTDEHNAAEIEQSVRVAAGMGKIEEVEVKSKVQQKQAKWKRREDGDFEQIATGKVRLGKDGRPRRPPKRRNSEDMRRDQLVETVLSEARCTFLQHTKRLRLTVSVDYFDAQAQTMPQFGSANNDDAILAQFQAEYYESIEEARQQQRKTAQASNAKGAKEAPKGPKLGGSKSVRAKLRLQEERAAKVKR